MGQIRKRGQFYQLRYYRDGQRIEETTDKTTWEGARDLLRKREGDIADGVRITARSTRLTFADAVKLVLDDYTVNSRKSKPWVDRRIKKHLLPVFATERLSSISTAQLRAFSARRLDAGASTAEINRELAIIRRAFRLAVQTEIYHGRVPTFPMLAEDNVRTGFFDRDTFAAVYDRLPAPLQPVIRFAYITGWRVQSEILPLEWRHVDRVTRTVRLDVGTTKNKRGRHIDYSQHPDLIALFDEQWRQHEELQKADKLSPYVFHRAGKRIRDYRGAWKLACRAAGLPGRRPHDLRRSAVRNLVRSGVPDTVAMKITGHKTRSVFDRYDITSEADVRDGLGRLAGTMGTNAGTTGDKSTGNIGRNVQNS